jgi:ABC-type Fe3+ transport system permease subunit
MSIRASKSKRRALVLLNYFTMFALIGVIYTGEMYGESKFIGISAICLMLLTVLSFVFLHARTRLWWLTHTKIENLDERQQGITHESLRYSYGIYTVLSLALLFVIALAAHDYDPNLIVAFAALHYLAHTLPGSILAWRQKEV